MLGAVVQIVLAAVVAMALFVGAFAVYNRELVATLTTRVSPKQRVDIFQGVKDLRYNRNEVYNTSNPQHSTFKDLALSINQRGGAEFAYNFWLYKPTYAPATNDAVQPGVRDVLEKHDVVLLLRGAPRKHRFYGVCGEYPAAGESNVLVKCPLVKLQRSETGVMDVLTVELNTDYRPDGVREMAKDRCTSSGGLQWSAANGHKLAVAGLSGANFVKKWFMVTVVVRDTNPEDRLPVRNKIQVQIFINGALELERYVDTARGQVSSKTPSILRQNFGPLYVAPLALNNFDETGGTGDIITDNDPFFMADLSYFNYGPSLQEIEVLYKAGFHKKIAPALGDQRSANDLLADSFGRTSTSDGKSQLRPF